MFQDRSLRGDKQKTYVFIYFFKLFANYICRLFYLVFIFRWSKRIILELKDRVTQSSKVNLIIFLCQDT